MYVWVSAAYMRKTRLAWWEEDIYLFLKKFYNNKRCPFDKYMLCRHKGPVSETEILWYNSSSVEKSWKLYQVVEASINARNLCGDQSHIFIPELCIKFSRRKQIRQWKRRNLNKWWKAKLTSKVQVQTVKNCGKINES